MILAFLAAILLCYGLYIAAASVLPTPWAESVTPYAGIAAIIAAIMLEGVRARACAARANGARTAAAKEMSAISALVAAVLLCLLIWAYFAIWYLLFYGLDAIMPSESALAVPVIGLFIFFVFHAVLFWLAPRDPKTNNNDDDDDDDDTLLWIIGASVLLSGN